MTETTSNKIIDRIQKLMNLAKAGSNVNESSTAFAQAQALLMKHKLTMAEVEIASAVDNDEPIVEGGDGLYQSKYSVQWKSHLANQVAILNSCKMFIRKSTYGVKYSLIGRTSDIEIVKYLFDSIVDQIENLCKATMLSGYGSGKIFSNNFKFGAVETVVDRLKAAKEEVRQEYSGTAAIVLVDRKDAEVQKWVDQNLKLGKPKQGSKFVGDNQARDIGRAAGNRVSLSKGIGGTGSKGYLK